MPAKKTTAKAKEEEKVEEIQEEVTVKEEVEVSVADETPALPRRNGLNQKDKATAIGLHEAGKTAEEIADHLQIYPEPVEQFINTLGETEDAE